MKVLVIGSGAREHALAWALRRRSHRVEELWVAPGNAGTAALGHNVDIAVTDVDALVRFARENRIDLTVVGPEGPLMLGVVDRFREAGLRCYGPTAAAARLEGSKAFSKDFMRRHGIPTAAFQVFDNAVAAKEYARRLGAPLVVKADGLAAGKGVVVATHLEEAERAIDDMLVAGRFGEAGSRVVVEEFLEGEEVSVHAVCTDTDALLLPSSQDHKRVHDGDRGPNTGGMGAIAPVPWITPADMERVRKSVILPVLKGMFAEGSPFTGTLYAGIMWTKAGPKVLEFNVRFGDPEAEVLLPLFGWDLPAVLLNSIGGKIPPEMRSHAGSAAAVVIAARGYPENVQLGDAIDGLNDVRGDDVMVFHGGTRAEKGRVVSAGGRILAASAWAPDLRAALDAAYQAVASIHIDGAFHRSDIGRRHIDASNERTKR